MGILYGAAHQSRLAKREVGIREVEAKQKAIRDAKLAEEKKRMQEGNYSNNNIKIYRVTKIKYLTFLLQRKINISLHCKQIRIINQENPHKC